MSRTDEQREQKKQLRLRQEEERVEKLCEFEKQYPDCELICGVDEVGRGPLAGPVVAGAVILPKGVRILHINDSKKLTEKRRNELFEVIDKMAVRWSVASASPKRIDEINILQADYEAMRKAIRRLGVTPDLILADAVTIPKINIRQTGIIHGDALVQSIAAASIMAKVTRDRYMTAVDKLYPEYSFASNKGYGTAAHIAALKKYGPCPIHRMTFIGKFIGEHD
ncbi:MAG: ribonuclease HII [Lachnospiraceae bacterium]|nr:ribonuclease HII [Lachnospiraceae bacterium]MCH4030583.1 ribonuclease HII [Lachnospiraceae bacterium]MCH4069792.1 ribonuclease HII [Lachnospiraceae bacterium]MCH4107269.1 ribonuclease HII [Lachnospiraceae bacterium]MCI1301876.1 ribonuclease HII [Lachnospiraceae bacterium]